MNLNENEKYLDFPYINQKQILATLDKLTFSQVNKSGLCNTKFYKGLTGMFLDPGPLLLCFQANDIYKFGQCIYWFNFRAKTYKNDLPVNKIIKRLFCNKSLKCSLDFVNLTKDFVNYNYILGCNIDKIEIEKIDSFSFAGRLAKIICGGGTFVQPAEPIGTVVKLTARFVEKIIQNRFNDFKIYYLYEAWSDWFYGIVCDLTFFLFDMRKGQFWILVLADND